MVSYIETTAVRAFDGDDYTVTATLVADLTASTDAEERLWGSTVMHDAVLVFAEDRPRPVVAIGRSGPAWPATRRSGSSE